MARDDKYQINYEQSPLIVDMNQKRRERFKFKKTPHPVLSRPRITEPKTEIEAKPQLIDALQEPLRAPQTDLTIWWPSPTQFKHIEANWAFFIGFILTAIGTGVGMIRRISEAVRGPWEEIGFLIQIPLSTTLLFLFLSFFVVRFLRVVGGPITTLAQLGRFSTLSPGVRLGMFTGLVLSPFTQGMFGLNFGNTPFWTVFSALGTMGLIGGIFGWVERYFFGRSKSSDFRKHRIVTRKNSNQSIFDTALYRETLPLLAAVLVAIGATWVTILDNNAGRFIADAIMVIGEIEIDRAFVLILLQAAILWVVFRWTARIVGNLKQFFGFKDLEDLN